MCTMIFILISFFCMFEYLNCNHLQTVPQKRIMGLQCPRNLFGGAHCHGTKHKSRRSSWCKHSVWPAPHLQSSQSPSLSKGTPPGCWSCRGWRCSGWSKGYRKDRGKEMVNGCTFIAPFSSQETWTKYFTLHSVIQTPSDMWMQFCNIWDKDAFLCFTSIYF